VSRLGVSVGLPVPAGIPNARSVPAGLTDRVWYLVGSSRVRVYPVYPYGRRLFQEVSVTRKTFYFSMHSNSLIMQLHCEAKKCTLFSRTLVGYVRLIIFVPRDGMQMCGLAVVLWTAVTFVYCVETAKIIVAIDIAMVAISQRDTLLRDTIQ